MLLLLIHSEKTRAASSLPWPGGQSLPDVSRGQMKNLPNHMIGYLSNAVSIDTFEENMFSTFSPVAGSYPTGCFTWSKKFRIAGQAIEYLC